MGSVDKSEIVSIDSLTKLFDYILMPSIWETARGLPSGGPTNLEERKKKELGIVASQIIHQKKKKTP